MKKTIINIILILIILLLFIQTGIAYANPDDIVIDATGNPNHHSMIERSGPFWVSSNDGFFVYIDNDGSVVYKITRDGGNIWSDAYIVTENSTTALDCWADWQTPGDNGTVIHMVYADFDADKIMYGYIDTIDYSSGVDVIMNAGGDGTFDNNKDWRYHQASITKTQSGKIATVFKDKDNSSNYTAGIYTSTDGDTWISENNSWWESSYPDAFQLYCGNEADQDDFWMVFFDYYDTEYSLKTYDYSGDSWSEQLITSVTAGASAYTLQFDGQIRLSDGYLILLLWNDYNTATADLEVHEINGAGSITQKTDVLTDIAEYATCSLLIDQSNNDYYVSFLGGTDWITLVKCYYKKSSDNGTSWSASNQTMQDDAEDDSRWVSSGSIKSNSGGLFMPVWYNNDLYDLYCSSNHSVSLGSDASINATSNFIVSENGSQWVDLSWSSGNATHYEVRYSYYNYPSNFPFNDSYRGYFGTASSANITGLSANSTVYFRLYSYYIGDLLSDNLTATTTTLTREYPDFTPPDTYHGVLIGDSILDDTGGTALDVYLSPMTGYSILNVALPGDDTTEMLARFSDNVNAHSPNFVLIEGGTNDIYNGDPKSTFMSNWEDMLDLCEADDDIELVIVSLIPACSAKDTDQMRTMDDWNISLRELADTYEKTMVVNTAAWFGEYRDYDAIDNRWDIIDDFDSGDGIHPSDNGTFALSVAYTTGFPLDYEGESAPTVTTSAASGTTCNSTNGNGNITSIGSANVTYRGFQYGIGGFSSNVSESGNWGTGNFSLSITGLTANTSYQYRAFAENSVNMSFGSSVNFTTSAASNPTFTTVNASSVTSSSARLNGTISGLDCLDADDTFWQWGLSSGNYTSGNYTDTANHSNGSVYHDISSLSANTTYYFRGAARIAGGAYQYGGELNFTTSTVSTPAATPQPGGNQDPAVESQDGVEYGALSLLPLIILSALAFWKHEPLLFLLASPAAMFIGLRWPDYFSTPQGLAIGIVFIAYSYACLGFSFITLFQKKAAE